MISYQKQVPGVDEGFQDDPQSKLTLWELSCAYREKKKKWNTLAPLLHFFTPLSICGLFMVAVLAVWS